VRGRCSLRHSHVDTERQTDEKSSSASHSFLTEQREKGPDSGVLKGETRIIEQSKLVAAAWRALSDEEKKVRSYATVLSFGSGF